MSHHAEAAPTTVDPGPPPLRAGGRRLRWIINLWLIFHLAAIIIAPASIRPSSDLVNGAWEVVHPYLMFLDLDHGHSFFAPEPAESTLLTFEAEHEDGSVILGRIPDRRIEPRLLYHRYFMLTEHMGGADDPLQPLWQDSYARHIGRRYGANRVRLTQVTHLLPTMERVRGGGRLDDPESFEEQPLGEFRCDD